MTRGRQIHFASALDLAGWPLIAKTTGFRRRSLGAAERSSVWHKFPNKVTASGTLEISAARSVNSVQSWTIVPLILTQALERQARPKRSFVRRPGSSISRRITRAARRRLSVMKAWYRAHPYCRRPNCQDARQSYRRAIESIEPRRLSARNSSILAPGGWTFEGGAGVRRQLRSERYWQSAAREKMLCKRTARALPTGLLRPSARKERIAPS